MIPSLLLIGLAIALVGSAFCWVYGCSKQFNTLKRDVLIAMGVIGTISTACLLWAFLIVWPTLYFCTLSSVAGWEAFQEVNLETYIEAVEATEGVTVERETPWLIDIAYQQQSLAVSDRIKELRDEIAGYNNGLKYGRALKGTPLGVFMPDIPNDLQLITLRIGE